MYNFNWDVETGGIVLTERSSEAIGDEVRPVFFEELDLLEFDKQWTYERTLSPLMWAIGRRYFYRGQFVAEAIGGGFFEKPTVRFYESSLHLEPIALNQMVEKNAQLLNGLTHRAIEFIYKVHEKYRCKVDAVAVAFSGGKDSLVVLDLVQRTLPPDQFVVVFDDTTMEISATYEAVEAAKKHWPHLRFLTARSDKPAEVTWREMGPPSRIHRWCCTVHKSAPTLFLLRKLADKLTFRALIYDGVRRGESQQRSAYISVSDGAKHSVQINSSPVLFWNSAEIFQYLFTRSLMLNSGYRYGFARVGCSVCPVASKWWDFVAWSTCKSDVTKFLEILREYTYTKGVSKNELEKFITSGGWRGRAGGRNMANGGNRVNEIESEAEIIFQIYQPRENWNEWVKTLGKVSKESQHKGIISANGCDFPFELKVYERGLEVIIKNWHLAHRSLRSFFRSVSKKTAYCVHCRGCEVECPTGALKIDSFVQIDEESCVHCGQCLIVNDKGCLAAKSLMISQESNSMEGVKGFNRYQHFGMRSEWLQEYFQDPDQWWHKNSLGNRQFEAMKVWLTEAGIAEKSRITELGLRLREMSITDTILWMVIWANLAERSTLIKWYVSQIPWGETITRTELVDLLPQNLSLSSRQNTIKALVGLLRDTPLGAMGLGRIGTKGKQTVNIYKGGCECPSELGILYCLYLYARKAQRHNFSVRELAQNQQDSPSGLFGLSENDLRKILGGLASRFGQYITAELVYDLDNILLNPDCSPNEVLNLVRRH